MTFRKLKLFYLFYWVLISRNKAGPIPRGSHENLTLRNLEVKMYFLGAEEKAGCKK